jgi:hypothetical protein
MATPAQIAANRRNAQNSTGPKTPEGKQIVCRNALRHGLLSTNPIVLPEEEADFEILADALHYERQPQTSEERMLVNRMADVCWRLRRASQIETGLFTWHRKKELAEPPATGQKNEAIASAEDVEVCNPGAQSFAAAFTAQSEAISRLGRHEAHLHRMLEKTIRDLERRQYARTLGIDPYYAERIGRYAAPGEKRRTHEGSFRPRPSLAESPMTVPPRGVVYFEPPEREPVVEEAPLAGEWEQAATATADVGFEPVDSEGFGTEEVHAPEEEDCGAKATASAAGVAEAVEDAGAVVEEATAGDELAMAATAAGDGPTEPAPSPGSGNAAPIENSPTGSTEEIVMATAASGHRSPGAPSLPMDRNSAFLQNKANFPANRNHSREFTSMPESKQAPGPKGRKGLQGKETVGCVPLPAAYPAPLEFGRNS